MRRIFASTRTITFLLLFGLPSALLGTLFGFVFSRTRQSSLPPRIENAIFDLGGVLMDTNKRVAIGHIGISKFLRYLATFHIPRGIQKKLYDIMDQIKPLDPYGPNALTPDGSRLLPQIFRDWLSGRHTCAQLLETVNSFIDNHPQLFANRAEQAIIRSAANTIFRPEAVAKIQRPVKAGIEFVKKCKKRGLNLFILSNIDAKSYELFRKRYPDLFNLFDERNIFISGQMGLIKPDPAIYEILLCEARIDPDTCVFFDDQKENVESARACGISAFQCTRKKKWICSEPDYEALDMQLDTLMGETEVQQAQENQA